MRRSLFAATSFGLSFALVAGCSARDERVSRSAQAVIGGAADTTHEAVAYVMTTDGAASPELCTGTLIAPRVVLTAGHCTFGQDASSLIVGFAPTAQFEANTVPVAAVVTYPGFSGAYADVEAGLDLGAIVLAEDAPVLPVIYDRGGIGGDGTTFTVVGYGVSSANQNATSGVRRSVDVSVSATCNALFAFGDASHNACHGDSGGPLFDTVSGGHTQLVGVVSFGDDVHCAGPSYAVRVARYAPWIDAVIAGSGDAGDCATCPPRPTDCAEIEGDAGAGASGDASTVDATAVPPGPSPSPGGGCAIVVVRRADLDARYAFAWLGALLLLARRRRGAFPV